MARWTEQELLILRDLRRQGLSARRIGAVLGRSKESVQHRIEFVPANENLRVDKIVVPDSVQLNREHRLAKSPRDLTSALMGYPLPGYSALERRA